MSAFGSTSVVSIFKIVFSPDTAAPRALEAHCQFETLRPQQFGGRKPSDQAALVTRRSISLRSVTKSMGLVSSASAPFSNALRFVSASP